MTVTELGRRMSSREFDDWQAFAALEPFGPRREDERAGVIASMIGAPYRPKGREPYTPADFFPELEPPKPPMTAETLEAKLMAAAQKVNSRGKRRQRKVPRD